MRATAIRGVDSLSTAFDRLRPAPPGVVILAYHRVGGRTATSIDLPTEQFAAQMGLLAELGCAVPLDRAADSLEGGGSNDVRRQVVVTFDDGTADWVDQVLPVLVRTGVPATFYVATRFVDEQRPFPDAGRPVSWAGLREMAASGLVTIGSHTHSHLLLDRVTPAAAADDLDRSIDLIGTELGADARHFAYPKALAASGEVASVVGRRFRSAAVAGNRVNPPGSANLQRLGRHPVQRPDRTDMDRFRARIGGGARLEGWVREKALPLRERGSVT